MLNSGLYSLVYFSHAVAPLDDDGIQTLLDQSRTKNARLNVTGLLLYNGDMFAQCLEGTQGAVSSLYATIRIDDRHRDARVLAEGAISERCFPGWSMAFRRIDPAGVPPPAGETDRAEALRLVLGLPTQSMMTLTLKSLAGTLLR